MNIPTKKAILAYIHQHDPRGSIVEINPSPDFRTGTIIFSSSIIQYRQETVLTGEKYAEAYLVVKLIVQLNYSIKGIELQKEYPAGHPTPHRPRVDILVNELDDGKLTRAFLFVEAKDPENFESERDEAIQHQLYVLADHERRNNLKYLMYFSVDFDGNSLIDKIDIIDFEQFPDFESWNSAGRTSLNLIPSDYGLARKSVYVKKDTSTLASEEAVLNRTAGPAVFAAIRRDIHDVLWGGGGTFYNDIFSNLVKIFLAKIYDEQTTSDGEPYQFQIQLIGDKTEPPSAIYIKVNTLFRQAQKDYLGYSATDIEKS